jgi:GTPase SAR1 family protein
MADIDYLLKVLILGDSSVGKTCLLMKYVDDKFLNNSITLYNQPVTFDTSYNAVLDVSYGIRDISGSYYLVDPSANVDLSVNGLGFRIDSSFNVSELVSGDNSLNFTVNAWDGKTRQPYFVKLHMETANEIQTLYLNNSLID